MKSFSKKELPGHEDQPARQEPPARRNPPTRRDPPSKGDNIVRRDPKRDPTDPSKRKIRDPLPKKHRGRSG